MSPLDAQAHFDDVAARYTALRTTDDEPVRHIGRALPARPLVAVDVGAGDGRYTARLLDIVPDGTLLVAVELNAAMLSRAAQELGSRRVGAVRARSEALPLADLSVDVVTTFNAIHHFDLTRAVEELGRVVRPGGDVFVYTRTPAQNAASIWGRRFPGFASGETRLISEHGLRKAFGRLGTLHVTPFRFARRASPAWLAQQVRGRHYSTFSLYDHDDLEAALATFLEVIGDVPEVSWVDQNLLLHVRVG